MGGSPRRPSAGILLFRRGAGGIEVLLGHPGERKFAGRDDGAWGIPKGEVDGDEPLFDVARREFREETSFEAPGDEAAAIPLGEIRKRSGKVVTAWAIEGDLDAEQAKSITYRMESPPGSGVFIDVPEFDRLAWIAVEDTRRRMRPEELPLVERLVERLDLR
jgi:predicted NUDIX family NTP pyrophosphohydrolase